MDEALLASETVQKIISDAKFWIALIGLLGAVIGGLITIAGNLLLHWLKEKPQRELDKKRIAILRKMLDDERFPEKWRKLSTLSAVIGTPEEEAKRLLFTAGARGSEKCDEMWGLIEYHPLPLIK